MSQTPKWWLSAGAGVFLLSVLVGYHQDQIAADSVLAGKIGMPPVVKVQDFDRHRHANLLNEVRLLGEAALGDATVVRIESEGSPRSIRVVPVYPVTSTSAPMANWYLRSVYDSVPRPMPRSLAPAIAEAADRLAGVQRVAFAFLISDADLSGDLGVVGEGLNGPLVSIFGTETGGGDIETAARAAFIDRGMMMVNDVQVIAPYPGGVRPATPVEDFSASRRLFEVIALGLVLLGAMQMFVPFSLRRARPDTVAFEEVQAVGEFPGVFEPIRTQEDLLREEQEASERRAASARRVLSRQA